MKTIDDIWALLAPEGEFKRRRGACERLWQGYEPGRQEAIYERIAGKLRRGEFVNQNPRTLTFSVSNDDRFVTLHYGYTRVRGTEVNSNNFRHNIVPFFS